jgi:hypothetical protein
VLTGKDGKPRTGMNDTVAVTQAGDTIALTEVVGEPGTYRSALRAWTTAQLRFDIKAGNTSVGSYRLNPFARDTRLHGIVA